MVSVKPVSKSDILDLLSRVVDPEIPVVSIAEMGILRDVVLTEDGCEVVITPTYTGCPAMGMIEADILALLLDNGIRNPTVSVVDAPAWTTDSMSEQTKEKLRQFGIAAPLHSSCMNWFKPSAVTVHCPRCSSKNTKLIAQFGSTACKSLYSCGDCLEPFDYFKCH